MITPACRADAGAATELLAEVGNNSVTTTPNPNRAKSTTNTSGLRFTGWSLSLVRLIAAWTFYEASRRSIYTGAL